MKTITSCLAKGQSAATEKQAPLFHLDEIMRLYCNTGRFRKSAIAELRQ